MYERDAFGRIDTTLHLSGGSRGGHLRLVKLEPDNKIRILAEEVPS